jgi:hypothetical protein
VTTKTTGAEWRAYHDDLKAWPPGSWYEDCVVTVNGVEVESPEEVAPTARVTIDGGVYWSSGSLANQDIPDEGVSLESHFRKWRKAQTVERLIVEVPKEKAALFREAMRRHGGKEIK